MASAYDMWAGNTGTGGVTSTLPWPTGAPNLNDPQAAYAQQYQQALAMNKKLYEDIEAGYTAAGKQLRRGQRRSMKQVKHLGKAERTDIRDQYNAQLGDAAQTLINRGLGNTTVQQSVNRGIEADRSKANIRLTGELAGLRSGLQERFANQRMALNQSKLGWMNTTTAAYPDFASFASLMQQQQAGAGAGGLMGGGFGGASVSSGQDPFSASARQERMNWVSNPATGSAYGGGGSSPGAPNYNLLPNYNAAYNNPAVGAAGIVGLGALGGPLSMLGQSAMTGAGTYRSAPVSGGYDPAMFDYTEW
jgi:hypothetical protein